MGSPKLCRPYKVVLDTYFPFFFNIVLQCEKRGREDYVQLLDGNTLDPRTMWKEASICGLASKPG